MWLNAAKVCLVISLTRASTVGSLSSYFLECRFNSSAEASLEVLPTEGYRGTSRLCQKKILVSQQITRTDQWICGCMM